jgi:pilus assembly protein Flp/PilA
MLSLIKRFYRHEDGATATEYAMLVVFIALAIAVGAQTLGNGVTTLFNNIGTTLTGVAGNLPTPPNPNP